MKRDRPASVLGADAFEFSFRGERHTLPMEVLDALAQSIGTLSGFPIMNWDCVEAVGPFFSEMEKAGWYLAPPDARNDDKGA